MVRCVLRILILSFCLTRDRMPIGGSSILRFLMNPRVNQIMTYGLYYWFGCIPLEMYEHRAALPHGEI